MRFGDFQRRSTMKYMNCEVLAHQADERRTTGCHPPE
jgi:hypothetical protein